MNLCITFVFNQFSIDLNPYKFIYENSLIVLIYKQIRIN